MSHVLGADTSPILSELLTAPDDGDAQVAASVNGPFQVLENARAGFYKLATGGLASEGWLRADAGGSNVSPKVFIGRVYGVVLSDEVFAMSADREILLSDVAGLPANLANDTWYYVYLSHPGTPATPGGGVRAPNVSVSLAPPTGLVFGGFSSLRYIGCFRTNGSGAPKPFYMRHGRYIYNNIQGVLSTGHATVATAVSLVDAVPPHVYRVQGQFVIGAGAGGYFAIFECPSGTTLASPAEDPIVNTYDLRDFFRKPGDALLYRVTNVAATAHMFVSGFDE